MSTNQLLILLADDDEDDCLLFKEAVEELALPTELVTVHQGEQLMNWLSQPSNALPDVLFLDLNMPCKNGFECLTEIKQYKKWQSLPVVIISTSLEPAIINELYTNGAFLYICKPTGFSELKLVIQQALMIISEKALAQLPFDEFVLTGQLKVIN